MAKRPSGLDIETYNAKRDFAKTAEPKGRKLKGKGGKNLLLMSHMDTVYLKGILAKAPFRVEGNKAYGPGIADDKGGNAVILHTLQILKDAGWNDYATLTVLFNPDEEIGSRGSGEFISATADQADVVLSFEPTAAKAVAKGESLLLGAAGVRTVAGRRSAR